MSNGLADIQQALNSVMDSTLARINTEVVAAGTQGSELNLDSIIADCVNPTTGKLRVVVVSASTNTQIKKLSPEQIFQDVHDPTSHAIRIIKHSAAGGTTPMFSLAQFSWKFYDPVNHAIRVSPAPD